jgi:peptidoglycan/LPS O-acetylase OafA/YrhL
LNEAGEIDQGGGPAVAGDAVELVPADDNAVFQHAAQVSTSTRLQKSAAVRDGSMDIAGTKQEIPALTGLRGVAALLVVWCHYSNWCAPYPASDVPKALAILSNTGGLAMSLFFALSGFVIAYNYAGLPWRAAPLRSLTVFASLRFSRLYPALLVFIVVSCAFRHPLRDMGEWIVLDLLSVQTWWPFSPVVSAGGPLGLAWSISTEIGMYLMFAGLMMLRGPERLVAIAVYLCALLFAALAIKDEATAYWLFYLSPYYRFLEFGAGALVAYGVTTGSLTVRRQGFLPASLSSRPLLFCGTISYSLYLFHDVGAATVARMLGLRLFGYVDYDGFGWMPFALFSLRFAAALVIAIGLSYAMLVLVEQPARRWLRGWFAVKSAGVVLSS